MIFCKTAHCSRASITTIIMVFQMNQRLLLLAINVEDNLTMKPPIVVHCLGMIFQMNLRLLKYYYYIDIVILSTFLTLCYYGWFYSKLYLLLQNQSLAKRSCWFIQNIKSRQCTIVGDFIVREIFYYTSVSYCVDYYFTSMGGFIVSKIFSIIYWLVNSIVCIRYIRHFAS